MQLRKFFGFLYVLMEESAEIDLYKMIKGNLEMCRKQ